MDEMLKPYISVGDGDLYAQGMFVRTVSQPPSWPAPLWYIGGIGAYATAMGMWPRDGHHTSDVAALFNNRAHKGLPKRVVWQGSSCIDPLSGRRFPNQVCVINGSW